MEERTHEVLDMDNALKERQGELQQRANLVQHKHNLLHASGVEYYRANIKSFGISLQCNIFLLPPSLHELSSVGPAGSGHPRAQTGDGEEGGDSAAVPAGQRERAERSAAGAHRQKTQGQERSLI